MKPYTFNKGNFLHYFCTNCGTSVAIQAQSGGMADMIGLNVRSFDDVDVKTLKERFFDGKAL